jgi:hypothetical protein
MAEQIIIVRSKEFPKFVVEDKWYEIGYRMKADVAKQPADGSYTIQYKTIGEVHSVFEAHRAIESLQNDFPEAEWRCLECRP